MALDGPSEIAPLVESLTAALAKLPGDLHTRQAGLLGFDRAFKDAFGKALEPAMNAFVESAPRSTFEDRYTTADTVNRVLQELSLAIRCPRTGSPCIMLAHTVDGEQNAPLRYWLETVGHVGPRTRNLIAASTSGIRLMRAPLPGVEPSRRSHGR